MSARARLRDREQSDAGLYGFMTVSLQERQGSSYWTLQNGRSFDHVET
jgi:hypothetical protein